VYNLQGIRESTPDAHGCSDSPIQNQNPKAVSNSAFPRNCFNALRVGSWRTPRQYTHSRMVVAGLLRVSCCSRVTLASKSWLQSKVSQSDFGTDALLPILLLRPWKTLRHLLRFGTTLPTPFLCAGHREPTRSKVLLMLSGRFVACKVLASELHFVDVGCKFSHPEP